MPSRKYFSSNEEYNKWFRDYRKCSDKMRLYNREYNKEWRHIKGKYKKYKLNIKMTPTFTCDNCNTEKLITKMYYINNKEICSQCSILYNNEGKLICG